MRGGAFMDRFVTDRYFFVGREEDSDGCPRMVQAAAYMDVSIM